ncbi:MAG: hypothetical protein K0Q59_506 [Paenibacillus sp.]|jgi:hypothetical protein|nr:hypothetical protein [Paenibacillus sp.]
MLSGIFKTIFALLGIISVLLGFATLFAILDYSNIPNITEEQYKAIDVGMSYEEVKKIIGTEGKLVSEYVSVKYSPETKKDTEYKYVGTLKLNFVYIFNRPEIRLKFTNDILVEKVLHDPF